MSRTAASRLLPRSRFLCQVRAASSHTINSRYLASLSGSVRATTPNGDGTRRTSSLRPRPTIPSINNSCTTSGSRSYLQTTSPSLKPKARHTTPDSRIAESLRGILDANKKERAAASTSDPMDKLLRSFTSDGSSAPEPLEKEKKAHHFHVYAHRHNTHITVTDPNRNPIISISCGNIGFKHSARKQYDSAFQLASYVLGRMQEYGINQKIEYLEVILRGFGPGREAATKALLGSEGRYLRNKVIRVKDATRLKFGGTRSPRPRRLG